MRRSWKGTNPVSSSSLSDQINDCAFDIDRWDNTIQTLCQCLDLSYANLCLFDRVRSTANLQCIAGAGAGQEPHLEYFFKHEIPELVRALDAGVLGADEVRIEDLTSRNTSSLNTYSASLRRLGLNEIVTVCLLSEPKRFAILILGREPRDDRLQDDAVSFLKTLLPSLRRAVMLGDRLSAMRTQIASLTRGVDALAFGAICLDAAGNIRSSNATAQRMLTDGDFVRSSAGRLYGANRQATDDLMRAIKQVTTSAQPSSVDLALPGASDGTIACVIGLPDNISSQPAQSAAVIFVANPALTYSAGLDAFGRLYDLTSAEKAVLQQLTFGRSPDEISGQLNISVATVRTHLARLFAKTKTAGQVALVARVNQMCLPII